jgi:hypothetical protein
VKIAVFEVEICAVVQHPRWWFTGVILIVGDTSRAVPHLFTSDGTARIPSMHYDGTCIWLKRSKGIWDIALIFSVVVLSDMVRCCAYTVAPLIEGSFVLTFHIKPPYEGEGDTNM